jgi:hypothetical protein
MEFERGGLRRSCAAAAMVLAVWLAPGAAAAQSAYTTGSYLSVGIGAFDVFEDEFRSTQFELQFRPGLKWWLLQPMVGASVTTDGSVFGYGGISLDINLTPYLVVRPSVAAGAYEEGDGKDLGGTLEFRSGVEVAWQFDNRMRLGLELYHRSNAGIYDHNPGEESLMLNFSAPWSALFER